MAANEPKMKINIGADTSEFNKGIKQAKSDLKSFGSVSDDILGKVGQAIGIDTKQVEQMAGAIRGMGRQMEASGTEGVAAFGKLLTSVNALSVGLGALGIAGVVASFKALNAEAEAFKNTVEGANIELQTAAFIDTYRQVFHDFNSETGKSVAEFESKWKKTFAMLGANFQQNFVNILTGKQAPAASLPNMFFSGNTQQMASAFAGGAESEKIAGEIYKLERQRKEQAVEVAKINADIADQMTIARDATASAASRNQAILEIKRLIEEKEKKTVDLEKQLEVLYQKNSDIASDNVAAADALLAQKQRVFDADRAITTERNSLIRIENSISKAVTAQNAAYKEQQERAAAIAKSRADLAALDLGVSGVPNAGATTSQGGGIIPREINTTALQSQLNAAIGNNLYVEVGIQIEKGSLIDLSNQVSSLMTGLAESMSAAVGGLIGDLMTGGDAWGNFANAALSAFGDMATSVGKIAIECGVAALGIKAALETLGPAGALAAIAAGAALVALGAAVKAGLSNVASGNYAASPSVASGSYSYGGGDYETRDVNIHVSGKLEADGDSLVAVINDTNNRNGYTT